VKRPHKSLGIRIGAIHTALTKILKPFLNTPPRFGEGRLGRLSSSSRSLGARLVGLCSHRAILPPAPTGPARFPRSYPNLLAPRQLRDALEVLVSGEQREIILQR
jgi:hypothetical protein